MSRITALILAAGKGSRFGLPKWKAVFGDKSFLEIVHSKLRKVGIENIICVYRQDSKPHMPGLEYVLNQNPEKGMFSSVYYGSRNLEESDGILVWPVDHPFPKLETLELLIEKFNCNKICIVKPVYQKNGKGGHPIILPSSVIEYVKNDDYIGGLRQLIIDENIPVCKVFVNDEDILKNINTVYDLKEHKNSK